MFLKKEKKPIPQSKKLAIIYRVCDGVEIINGEKRCFNIRKTTLIKKCLLSLERNIAAYNRPLHFYCIADNCSEELIKFLKDHFPQIDLQIYEKLGNAGSFCKCVEIATSLDDYDQVFFLEDDYLFLHDDVLCKLNKNLNEISSESNTPIAIMPDDYPDRYTNNRIETECRITNTGHFLRINKSTCTFATFAGNIKKFRKYLMVFKEYTRGTQKAIVQRNKLWKKIPLYQPIPAWTLHCQLKEIVPRYIDFEQLKTYFESPL